MRLYQIARIHRISGLALGAVLFILGLSGFFLDHENFEFLSDTRISPDWVPDAILAKEASSFTAFLIDSEDADHFIAAGKSGIYNSFDRGKSYRHDSRLQTFAIIQVSGDETGEGSSFLAATTDGIYQSVDGGRHWDSLALSGQVVESITRYRNQVFAVVDKTEVFRVMLQQGRVESIQQLEISPIAESVLPKEITLGRLVRDLHYGRGLFSGIYSLLINDYSALVLVFLAVSGLVIYFKTRNIRLRKTHSKQSLFRWRAVHSNRWMVYSFVPIFILLVTGVLLDHPDFFRSMMKQTRLSTAYLPPVYRDLSADIWGFDYDGKTFRIGNRLGVFKSPDLKNWQLETEGFAWRMKRLDDDLFVSGMGAPNHRFSQQRWVVLKGTPHMPRDITFDRGQPYFLTRKPDPRYPLPKPDSVSLYMVLLGLHDGELFHPYWVFVNDLAALAAIILVVTGYLKWRRHRARPRST